MRHKTVALAALLLAVAVADPGWARTVTIETTMPLSDHSPAILESAIKRALDATVQGATAMGLSRIRLDGARVLENAVVVRMVATDDESEDASDDENLAVSIPLEDAWSDP